MVGERVRSLSSVVRVCDSDGVGRGRYFNAHTPIPLFYNPHHASRCIAQLFARPVVPQRQAHDKRSAGADDEQRLV